MFPIIPANSATAPSGNSEGIFGFGYSAGQLGMTNLVSDAGVVASDTTAVGYARYGLGGCEYGGDKGIFAYGSTYTSQTNFHSMSNLVSNAGVVASDVTGVGTARQGTTACSYGDDKGIFGFGNTPSSVGMTNLVSNAGVIASDVSAVGTARYRLGACEYGGDKGIFGYGNPTTAATNLVSNTGVVATDTTGVGTARYSLAACGYGYDKGIFSFGTVVDTATNLVSNTGVVASDVTQVGTARVDLAATQYGEDKGIFGYGYSTPSNVSITNLVSNAGVIATDQAATTGTARAEIAACSFN